MTKPRKENKILTLGEIRYVENIRLAEIAGCNAEIETLEAEAKAALQILEAEHSAKIAPIKERLKTYVSMLMDTMRSNKKTLFDGTDVVRLTNGSLIHSVAEKVSIPRDALAMCEELGFDEAIKIVKSLDRDAVEKWPDERLVLIGAERKQKEEFSYDLAKKLERNGDRF